MNATVINCHPFRAAAQAAFSELSSDSAHRYYSLKAQKDVQNVLDTSITLCTWIYQLAELTYMMGVQCRAWCDVLETNAQASARPVLLLAPAQVHNIEDPWQVEADYERVEFSPSIAAQTVTSPMLMLSPASTGICGLLRNPAPKDMPTEVKRMIRAAAPDKPKATGKPKRERKASTGEVAEAKPKRKRAVVK